MNLDKTITDLTKKLDELYPLPISDTIKNDGINYWKGKEIISTKKWNEIFEKNSSCTAYKITLISRKPLQYFPDDFNGPISSIGVGEELTKEIQKWNTEYYDLLEFRKNPTLGRQKCSNCVLSGFFDDPLFIGIEKVFARIVSDICNKDNADELIGYPCKVMNFFKCPFDNIANSTYPYKKEELFVLQRIAFAIEQAISTFLEATRNNEIIYQVDFEKDTVQEIHTNYNGESDSWGWKDNAAEQLSKVKPISPIQIINEQDIYHILTNREKLEYLLLEYEKIPQLDYKGEKQVCCDENTPCVPTKTYNDKSNNKNIVLDPTTTIPSLITVERKKEQQRVHLQEQYDSHTGEIRYSKTIEQILLKQNRQTIIDFVLDNKDSIRIEDLKIYEPIYTCYREKGDCILCNALTNIICKNCNNHNNKEFWLCTNHWQEHAIHKHTQIIR